MSQVHLGHPGASLLEWRNLALPALSQHAYLRTSYSALALLTVEPPQRQCSQTCSLLSLRRTTSPPQLSAPATFKPWIPACTPCLGLAPTSATLWVFRAATPRDPTTCTGLPSSASWRTSREHLTSGSSSSVTTRHLPVLRRTRTRTGVRARRPRARARPWRNRRPRIRRRFLVVQARHRPFDRG
jgi:hypothetical protein